MSKRARQYLPAQSIYFQARQFGWNNVDRGSLDGLFVFFNRFGGVLERRIELCPHVVHYLLDIGPDPVKDPLLLFPLLLSYARQSRDELSRFGGRQEVAALVVSQSLVIFALWAYQHEFEASFVLLT